MASLRASLYPLPIFSHVLPVRARVDTFIVCSLPLAINALHSPILVINPVNQARMRSEGYGTWSVCLSVCLSVRVSSRTTGYKAANEWHHQLVVNNEKMDMNVAWHGGMFAM